jgi:hypothetical protein
MAMRVDDLGGNADLDYQVHSEEELRTMNSATNCLGVWNSEMKKRM